MSAQRLITDHLDLWTGAVTQKRSAGRGNNGKIELTGIKKLRELILELAVRGKLVEQDPNDVPASVLLERITEEKARLVKEGTIKKPKKLPAITEEEKPFELPAGWAWFRVGSYLEFQYGKALAAKDRNESGGVDVYGSNGVVGKHDEVLIEEPCIIIGRKGSAGALNKALSPSWTTDVAYYLTPPEGINFHYCYLLLLSLKLDQLGKGIKPGVNRNEAYFLVAALPPLSEQHRIVEKIDELMALCDRLEQQIGDQLEAHEVLVDTLLDALTGSADAAEVAESWARIAEHFDTLFTTEASIDKLKQAILQLAVMGRLVEQDSNDEPASVLLEMISEEKARLVKEGKIKKPKKYPPITENDLPNSLPPGWKAARIDEFINLTSGQHLKGDEYSNEPDHQSIPYLTGPAEFGTIHPEPTRYTKERRAIAQAGDILITCKGSGVGKLNWADKETAISRQLMAISPILASKKYSFLLMDSLRDSIRENVVGIAIPGISREDIIHAIAWLPPLEEQHRIVEKVDELMALCDQLKARLGEASETTTHLAEAVVGQAVS